MLRSLALAVLSLTLAQGGASAQADGDFPNRPVRMIAAAAPGVEYGAAAAGSPYIPTSWSAPATGAPG